MRSRIVRQIAFCAVSGALFLFLSRIPYAMPVSSEPTLIVAFRFGTSALQVCRQATPEELAKMLAHMRQEKICERKRPLMRMVVEVGGRIQLEKVYEPLGYSSDGVTVAYENLRLQSGEHDVSIEIKEGENEGVSSHVFRKTIRFSDSRRYLVDFKKDKGFILYGEQS